MIGNIMDSEYRSRVLIFSLAYFPVVGGAEIAVKEITDRLGDSFDFDLVTLQFNKSHLVQEVIGSVNVYRIGGSKAFFPIKAFFLANRLHRLKSYRISWSIMAAYAGFAALFFKLLNPKIPFLLTLQEGDSEKHILNRVGVFYPLWRLIFKKSDYIQVISQYLADFARRYGATCPVEVVPNGVSLEKFKIRSTKSETNSNYKNSNVKTIITTSRLVYKNGIDTLIRAVALLKAKSYKLKAIIVGDGPDRSKLEQLARDLGIVDRIKFIGHVNPDRIPEYLSTADIFVRPSRSEGLGNSFLEAMAAGLPVVGTAVGGIPDFLTDGETGLFSKVDDPESLADKIDLLFTNAELYQGISENGKRLVYQKYSSDLVASRMKDIFRKITRVVKKETDILMAVGIYPPDIGGPAVHAKKLTLGFRQEGFGVKVVSYGDSASDEVAKVSRKIPSGLRHMVYFIKCFKLAWHCGIIYAHDATAAGLPAFIVAKILGKRFFIRVGGDILWERVVEKGERFISMHEYYARGLYLKDRPIMFQIIRLVLKGANKVVVTADMLKDIYINYYGLNPDNIIVILNPMPLRQVDIGNPNGFEAGIVLFAGRLVPYKNLTFLINVFDKVRQRLNKGKLYLIGDGPDKKNLESLAENSFSAMNINFFPPMSQSELFEKIKEAAVCVGPALTEFNPNFILESLSLGKPVLLSRENGLSVKLPEEFVFYATREGDLENKLVELIGDEKSYEKALKKITGINFRRDWANVLEDHLAVFGMKKNESFNVVNRSERF